MAGTFKARDVRAKLENKFGFERSPRNDHPEYRLVENGRVLAVTHVSHGKKGDDLGPYLIGAMARQLNVTSNEFRQMIRCTLSRDEYVKKLLDE